MRTLLIGMIVLYQKFHVAFFRSCCRFYPSCSNYAIDAIQTWGACRGLGLTAYRILRCNPFCKSGLDPVPKRKVAMAGVKISGEHFEET